MDIALLRTLIALGLGLLLILLRLDAERFGAAEYDEADVDGRAPSFRRRLAWYALGIGLVVAALLVHPAPDRELRLGFGNRLPAVAGGILFGLVGTGAAVGFALFRYRALRLPPIRSYPGALVNDLLTAFIDEAAFRGILLGFVLSLGIPIVPAVIGQALLYALATRLAAPGRDLWMVAFALGIGLVAGWLTALTGGIAAAFLGHAITRFAMFVSTGHAGRPAPRGRELEEVERRRRPPDGWRVVGIREPRER
ncbi:MAG TPA: CPBP family intramembrane glutamic endopeptidase [Candidatus Limnocylindrales bacterium]|nr:CPBP family intramembrane glutamic endopeptidase [Candidatus Limnocylindrales bacterium]